MAAGYWKVKGVKLSMDHCALDFFNVILSCMWNGGKPMDYVLCHFCGDEYNKKRKDLGYRSCLD